MPAMADDAAGRSQYERHIVAFADLLGFGALVKRPVGRGAARKHGKCGSRYEFADK